MKTKLLASLFAALLSVTAFAGESKMSVANVKGATTVDTKKAKELFDKETLFIDVRLKSLSDSGRIAGSILLDYKNGKFTKEALMEEAGVDEGIVIYCNGVKCPLSAAAAEKALSWGYKKVYYYREGYPVWKKAGYPIE